MTCDLSNSSSHYVTFRLKSPFSDKIWRFISCGDVYNVGHYDFAKGKAVIVKNRSLSFFGVKTFEKLSRSYCTRRAWLCQNVNKRVIMRPGRHTKPVNVAILGFLTDYKRRHGEWPNLQKECLLLLFSPLLQKVSTFKKLYKVEFLMEGHWHICKG